MQTAHSPNPAAATIASRIGPAPDDDEDRRNWGPLTAITPTTIAPIPTICGQGGESPSASPTITGTTMPVAVIGATTPIVPAASAV